MTSVHYQYARNGVTNNNNGNGPSSTNKSASNIRGRTESPGIRTRYQRLTSSGQSNVASDNTNSASRRNPPIRNPPERISANPIEQYRQNNSKVNGLATNYMNKTGLMNNANTPQQILTPRERRTEQLRIASTLSNNQSNNVITKTIRLNDSSTNSNINSKPQKYLTTHSNLNQMSSVKKQNSFEENFANSLSLNNQQQPTYTTNGSVGSINGAHGSLLRAAQSKHVSNGTSSSQFYPAQHMMQHQQQTTNSSYKIPSTLPTTSTSVSTLSNSSSINNNNNNNQSPSHNYYNSINEITDNNHELNYRGIVGLKNLGNTCFMNSVLQCLSNTKCLLDYCLTNSYQSELNTHMSVMKGSLFNSYASLIKQMWSGGSIVSLQDFKGQLARFAPRFVGYAQQDAEEFLYYLIKGLHEDVNLIRKKPSPFRFDEKAWDRMSDSEKSQEHWSMNLRTDNSRISDMFVGQLKSTLKCTKCDYKSPTYELFWHLAVPIPAKSASSIRLDDCIKLFMSEEILDGDNKPTCSRCNEKRRCTKRYTIEKLPKILVIHLKRFLKVRYNNKINSNVDYPIESLDMSRYLGHNVDPIVSRPSNNANQNNCIYDLYGISLHSGTESSGHYVAYCKHPYRKKWNYFNDTQVREISKSSLQDANAYILFYELRN